MRRRSILDFMRREFDIIGVVQGVGFRPAVFRAAKDAGLSGWIQNRAGSVRLVLQGADCDVSGFIKTLSQHVPTNARIDKVSELPVQPDSEELNDFLIKESVSGDVQRAVIPADLAMCDECRAEIFDPSGRRYLYPFTTCTQCGPRYTVIKNLPYDRERTTMDVFPMCAKCRAEYDNPLDRRFHAESIACPECGPELWIEDSIGRRNCENPLLEARKALHAGKIVAIRGMGGYLLAVNAFDADAVRRLREKKRRPHKPFAVMAFNVDTLKRYCHVPDSGFELLSPPRSSIVVLDLRHDTGSLPARLISPDTASIGAMLPVTPLQMLLFPVFSPDDHAPAFELLVMTSGNRRGEPVCISNDEARERLAGIADLFLMHNREINLRCDDSLCLPRPVGAAVWRRARGFAPEPIVLSQALEKNVLALGAEMKNTIAFGSGFEITVSPHVGDLDTPEALSGFDSAARALPLFLQKHPDVIAVDKHPDMHSALYGEKLAKDSGVPLVRVQHHHAHGAGCLAEHGFNEGLALVFDGTGLGDDGTIWGAELLEITGPQYRRLASFRPVRLPGGDAAVLNPARQLIARWFDAGVEIDEEKLDWLGVTGEQAVVWSRQCETGFNAPLTHAAGRLFDSFSVLLGIAPPRTTYDGQPAIRLEALALTAVGKTCGKPGFKTEEKEDMLFIDWRPAFQDFDIKMRKELTSVSALSVHHAIAESACVMVEYGIAKSKFRHVALSGGVFTNRIVESKITSMLEEKGLKALMHKAVPCNDGGVSFGQAVIAGTGV